jgi:hypothetical protein
LNKREWPEFPLNSAGCPSVRSIDRRWRTWKLVLRKWRLSKESTVILIEISIVRTVRTVHHTIIE